MNHGWPIKSPFCATVLVVGSESAEIEFLRESLEGADYKVLSASDGDDALRILGRSLSRIDLVISEMALAAATGEGLGAELARLNPRLPLVLISDDALAAEHSPFPVITRPFRAQILLQYVRAALEVADGERLSRMANISKTASPSKIA